MLTNTGALSDGSIHSDDLKSLREVGKRIRENGWPKPEDAIELENLHDSKKDKDTAPVA